MAVRKKITYTVSSANKRPARSKNGGGAPVVDVNALIRNAETFYRKNRLEDAATAYGDAIALAPDNPVTLANRALVLIQLNRFNDALDNLDQAIARVPQNAEFHHRRAIALRALNRLDEAIAAYDRVITLDPGHVYARNRRGTCLMLVGRFTEGWRDYENRWDEWREKRSAEKKAGKKLLDPDNFGKPKWDGRPAKATLLIWAEQGLGEQILFASMLDEAAARVQQVIVAVEPRLQTLFARSFPQIKVTTFADAVKRGGYDLQIPIGGLGAIFRNSSEDFLDNRKAYLKADANRAQQLRKTAGAGKSGLCGLSWQSNNAETGNLKSLQLDTLLPLLKRPKIRFIDLQYGDTAAERATLKKTAGIDITRLDDIDNMQDIDGLAALIEACDLVITISNTTAHLAGALGKPVFLLLPYSQGRLWYWQTQRSNTLWYPGMRVFRQQTPGDWAGVVAGVISALDPQNKPANTR
jgi:tetratricopeptide (TPR) repeat protein